MRRLVVNADDLGADVPRNRGILEAVRAGAVTSVSVLANGPALDDAVERLAGLEGRHREISVGAHLNLSEGFPLARGLRRLVGPDGRFRGKAGARRLLEEDDSPELAQEVLSEIEAQLTVLRDRGLGLVHVDGHQHVHACRAALAPTLAAARRHRIPWVRVPEETPPEDQSLPEELVREGKTFSEQGCRVRARALSCDVETPDHFRGLYLKGRLSVGTLRRTVETLPDGLTELMVHPGRRLDGDPPGPFSAFSTRDREHELEVLLDPLFRSATERAGVLLVPFPEKTA